MSLNDDVDDGLVEDTDEVNPTQPVLPAVTIKPAEPGEKSTPITNDDLFGVGAVEGELPNINAEFVELSTQADKVSDLATIKTDIGSSCTVCKEDAELIDTLVPGFISPDHPLGMYTEKKTRTQAVETGRTLTAIIDKEFIELQTRLDSLIDKSAEKFTTLTRNFEEGIVEKSASSKAVIEGLVDSFGEGGVGGKFYLFNDKSNINDILDEKLTGLCSRTIDDKVIFHLNEAISEVLSVIYSLSGDFRATGTLNHWFCSKLPDTPTFFFFKDYPGISRITDKEPFIEQYSQEVVDETITLGQNRRVSIREAIKNSFDSFIERDFAALLNIARFTTTDFVKTKADLKTCYDDQAMSTVDKLTYLKSQSDRITNNIFLTMDILGHIDRYFKIVAQLAKLLEIIKGMTVDNKA